ncbi:MAG: ATP-binding protein [Omnitrophica WOR_2 bacterium]
MFHSIRLRIAIPYVILILLVMAVLGFYLTYTVRTARLADLEQKLLAESRMTAEFAGPMLAQNSNPQTLENWTKHWAEVTGARVTIIASGGRVLSESSEDPALLDNHLNRLEVQQALAQGQGSSTRFSKTLGYNMMYAATLIHSNGQLVGIARVALPVNQVEEGIASVERTFVAATLLAGFAAILLAIWIAGRTTEPVRYLREAVQQISIHELDQTLIPSTKDEVGELADAFNTMTRQLHKQVKALNSESSRLSAVLQNMTDGVLIADEQGRIQLINPAAERMFGVTEKNSIGHSLAEVLRYYQLVELWQNCQKTGQPQVNTFDLGLRKIYLQGIATPLKQALPGSILLLFQDITRLRQLETMRRDFISNLSHELRTPLASLKALTETLQDSLQEDPEASRHFLESMDTEVDALTQMVNELLELSRIESGKVPLRLVTCSPCELIENAVERLRLQAERKGLTLEIHCPAEIPRILADPTRMEQVLVNLLHNAIKFTPLGGTITLAAVQKDQNILFKVQDTGIGIAREDLSRIFERFYKTDRARSGGGTGLGLAIARHMVEAHGGKIWAESQEGHGSTFLISLPILNK